MFPAIFAVTGLIMWLRKRASRRRLEVQSKNPQLRPAE
jgi:hypothetical protein